MVRGEQIMSAPTDLELTLSWFCTQSWLGGASLKMKRSSLNMIGRRCSHSR